LARSRPAPVPPAVGAHVYLTTATARLVSGHGISVVNGAVVPFGPVVLGSTLAAVINVLMAWDVGLF